jgi:hypothetical protein
LIVEVLVFRAEVAMLCRDPETARKLLAALRPLMARSRIELHLVRVARALEDS